MTTADRAGPELRTVPRNAICWAVSSFLVWVFAKLYLRLRAEGAHHVPRSGPVLLVANHASYLDPPLVGTTAGRWVAFLAQAGLARFAPMRWWLRQVGVTLIDRRAPSTAALRLVADCLARGEVVGIFPEGTRSADGSIGPFRSGVEFLVRRTSATVVPIGIDGSHRAFPRGAWLPRPHRVVLRYGEPWTAARVLAPGGVDALRRCIAALARADLQEQRTDRPAAPTTAPAPSPSAGDET